MTITAIPIPAHSSRDVCRSDGSSCAVIASDRVGAAADLVQHGVNGLVVPHDSQTALTAAMRRLVTAPEETRRMGRASLAIIDGWSFEQDLAGLRQALKLGPGP